jgi:hypothetical protein
LGEDHLSKALEKSTERLILLEGEPGSGKSVALRHVAHKLADRASKANRIDSIIPVYINLKELHKESHETINRKLIEKFVISSVNRINISFVEEFFEREFEFGRNSGTWLFLFDSFDELPEILSSTESDDIIWRYSSAISDFLSGVNKCRGIVSSRHYHGPLAHGWKKFRIVDLSSDRQKQLIRHANLEINSERNLRNNLELANEDVRRMASNPMLLGLLCEHIRQKNPFPNSTHEVFTKFIDARLDRDTNRIKRRFDLSIPQVRIFAENIAFSMVADSGLGLKPTRKRIYASASRLNLSMDSKGIDDAINALEFIRLGRSERLEKSGEDLTFTFAHRRFQEYFATCVLLREPDRVSTFDLLTDGRWREPAVVLCQMGNTTQLDALFKQVNDLLSSGIDEIRRTISVESVEMSLRKEPLHSVAIEPANPPNITFTWPPKLLHVLEQIQ